MLNSYPAVNMQMQPDIDRGALKLCYNYLNYFCPTLVAELWGIENVTIT